MKTNKTATVTRLEEITPGSDIKDWKAAGEVTGMFMPLSDEMRQIAAAQGIIGKAFIFYASEDPSPSTSTFVIQETDRLTIDGIVYEVKGIKKYDVGSTLDHLKILLEERKQ